MTQYLFVPSEAPTEAAWPAATARYSTSYYARTVGVDRDCPVRDRVYKLSQTGASHDYVASFDAIDGDSGRAASETLCCWRDDGLNGNWESVFWVWVRASGAAGAGDGNMFIINTATYNTKRIFKSVAGVQTQLGSVGWTSANGTWYWMRTYANGSALKVRVWADGAGEPAAWDLEVTDATFAATAGWIGLSYSNYATSGAGRFGYFSVGTNGDTPPGVTTRTTWRQWLQYDAAYRTLLAEVSMMDTATPTTRYLSNRPYQSLSYDTPASQIYTTAIVAMPNWQQVASELFSGRTSISIGELLIDNADASRDDWLLANMDGREVRLLLGGNDWARTNFRTIAIGVVEYVKTDGYGRLSLVLRDKQRLADRAVSESVIPSGDNADRLVPVLLGSAWWVEPVAIDYATLEYQIHDGAVGGIGDVYDNGVALTASATVSSVNAGTDTITTTVAHGMTPGYEVVFATTGGNVVAGTIYYAITGTSGSALKISATRGGAAKDLNGSETGTIAGKGRAVDLTTGKLYLATTPTGEVRIDTVNRTYANDTGQIKSVVKDLLATNCGLAGEIDDATFAQDIPPLEDSVGIYLTERTNAVDVVDLFARDYVAAWGVSRDGLYYLAPLVGGVYQTFPFTSADIIGGLVLERVLMPVYSTRIKSQRNSNPSTQFASSVSTVERLRRSRSHYWEAVTDTNNGTDSQANHALAVREYVVDSYTVGTDIVTKYHSAFDRKAAVWSFETTLKALDCRVGDQATITYPRYGFDAGLSGRIVAARDDLANERVRLSVLVLDYSQAAAP